MLSFREIDASELDRLTQIATKLIVIANTLEKYSFRHDSGTFRLLDNLHFFKDHVEVKVIECIRRRPVSLLRELCWPGISS